MNRWITYPIIISLGAAMWVIPTHYKEPAGIVLFSLALTIFAVFTIVAMADLENKY